MKKIFFGSILVLSLLSCSENKSRQAPTVENAVDNAESSVSGAIKKNTRYSSREGNLVHEIYQELIKNDQALQDLDKRIAVINQETEDAMTEYDDVIQKSETYYNDATALSNSVTDSVTKKQIEKEIKTSSEKYDIKTQTIRDLIAKIKTNRTKVHDQYVVFKIRKTLPEIEKYQNAHPLKTDSLNQFINKQNKLLEELKNLK
ncbi:hypothetical protein J2795_001257 [Chryseobacterium bernardetii]|uniref:Cell-wall binding lipoprotein n=2 Tax=Chryseobacterium TaxID=59732 RepID=A0A543EJP8_9FLAO|nr:MULTISPECIES: hypothetical protein [Chryseobacterium]MDR6370200.1 hypothetical protein [Chryseobacterium vietnamense]MDR6440557.1 hypothetical protein [Chryseobacterium bernardetii]TQM21814.1 hypothetical protein FB551_1513 [Chryseobacterium aquifrigidense]